jgi:hypothetical protein
MQELMSMEHTRSGIKRLIPIVGDSLLTNKRRPILTVTEVEPLYRIHTISLHYIELLLETCAGRSEKLIIQV